jgi:methylaspartate ammonia-lyase
VPFEGVSIAEVICTPGRAGFFFDDQAAIRAGAPHEGFGYQGPPVSEGYRRIRQPAESVSVMLLLSDGEVAFGDCAAVQYSGAAGRDRLFRPRDAIEVIRDHVRPRLLGMALDSFRNLAAMVDGLEVGGERMHSAVRYGVTQALLDAVARAHKVTMAEVIRDEYRTGIPIAVVPMFVQCGDERYESVERMILKEVEVLPHGLVNNVATKVGEDGEILLQYVKWVRDRVFSLRESEEYEPLLHFDCYGTIGEAFEGDVVRIAGYLARLAAAAAPLSLRIEHPLDAGSREGQILAMAALRLELRSRQIAVELVVDEWCNTLEDIEAFVAGEAADVIHVKLPDLGGVNNAINALLYVKLHGLKAYCGGSCTETDRSAQVSAHIAMACGADQVLAKPGMGVDEGLLIVGNEMARVASLTALREQRSIIGATEV